jgi:hypothetical protein
MHVVPLDLKHWLARGRLVRVRPLIIVLAALAAVLVALTYRQIELRAAPAKGGADSFADCEAARAAGVAPLLRGLPGYSARLDPDGDGVACE